MSDFIPAPEQKKTHPYQKLGGWLLFIVVSNIISLSVVIALEFTQAGTVSSLRAMLASGTVDWMLLFTQFVTLYALAMGAVQLIMIIRRDARFLRFYELSCVGTVVTSILSLITALSSVNWSDAMEAGLVIFFAIFEAIAPVGSIFIWYAYYTQSVRVRTYMGSDEYLRLAWIAKKDKGPKPAVPDGAEEQAVGAAILPPES